MSTANPEDRLVERECIKKAHPSDLLVDREQGKRKKDHREKPPFGEAIFYCLFTVFVHVDFI